MIERGSRGGLHLACAALLLAVAVLVAGCRSSGGGPVRPSGPPITVPGTEEWYAANEPLVREYLTTLPDAAIGQPLEGIKLSDGRQWFEGDTYLGRPGDLPPKTYVTLLRSEKGPRAYMWIEEGGVPLPLAACQEGENRGIRARRLAGQIYPWKALRPGHGVVFTPCPPLEWLSATGAGS